MPQFWPALKGLNSTNSNGSSALISSALAFSLMTVCVKHLGGRIPIAEILFARSLISISITLFLLKRQGVSPWGKQKNLLFLRGLLGTAALFCVFYALATLPLSAATVIQYTYPTFTAIGAWFFLGEKIKRRIGIAVLIGWMGITMVARPTWITKSSEGLPSIPVFIAIAGAILTAFAYICVRKLSQSEHELVIIYYFPFLSIVVCLPLMLRNFIEPSGVEWLWLLGTGIFTQFGQMGITRGLHLLSAAKASSINYVQVIFATFWGYLLFEESIDVWSSTGAVFVLLGTLISLSGKD
ncbi:DMT family transporter [Prochlorococcus sp. MIT 1341]|uniref:DMT family transporter n=1 Tax=Prochlorococcus sp. MIT 1341 TaxID=3096221 RepID=UPI002A74FF56|nr:DMT family transporter [Prochlorococcus sp. MIT 1341]